MDRYDAPQLIITKSILRLLNRSCHFLYFKSISEILLRPSVVINVWPRHKALQWIKFSVTVKSSMYEIQYVAKKMW